MVADDVGLPVPVQVRFKLAVVAAGHLAHDPAFHLRGQHRVLDEQVGYCVVPHPPHVLQVPFGVGGLVFRREHLGRMVVCDVLALKACQGGRRKDVLRQPVDLYGPLRVAVQSQLPGQIILHAGAVDGHIPADEVAFRRPVDVRRDAGAVICNGHQSAPPIMAA